MSVWKDTAPPGWFDEADIVAYQDIYRNVIPENGHAVEVGVYRGRSLMSVADVITDKNITVTCIDDFKPFREDRDPNRYEQFMDTAGRFGIIDNLCVLHGDSLKCSDMLDEASQDFIFLDADHSQERVSAEIKAFKPKLKPNGLMGGHDYPSWYGVYAAVNEAFPHIKRWPESTIWLQQRQQSTEPQQIKIGIVTPSYDARMLGDDALLKAQRSSKIHGFANLKAAGSILTHGHNMLWCWALNARRDGMTHLLYLHSDIMPEAPNWLDLLIEEFWTSGADVLGAIVPIKDARGLTSIAFDTPNIWGPRRLTQAEAHSLPVTWTADNILLNTGLLLIDFTQPWVEGFVEEDAPFTIRDRIIKVGDAWHAEVRSEDWEFSRKCHKRGLKLFATRVVPLAHHGSMAFPSRQIWGAPHDPDAAPYPEGVTITAADGTTQHLSFEDNVSQAS